MGTEASFIYTSAITIGGVPIASVAGVDASTTNLHAARTSDSGTFIFKISHLGSSWMIGTFDGVSGGFTFDSSGDPAGQTISVEIDTASVDTSHAERDKHLRSPDFLDVEKFPAATLVSSRYEGDAEGGTMNGDLTLMGVTRPVSIAVSERTRDLAIEPHYHLAYGGIALVAFHAGAALEHHFVDRGSTLERMIVPRRRGD